MAKLDTATFLQGQRPLACAETDRKQIKVYILVCHQDISALYYGTSPSQAVVRKEMVNITTRCQKCFATRTAT
jgi:hypothetical protein